MGRAAKFRGSSRTIRLQSCTHFSVFKLESGYVHISDSKPSDIPPTCRISSHFLMLLVIPKRGQGCLDLICFPAPNSSSLNLSRTLQINCGFCFLSDGGCEGKVSQTGVSLKKLQTTCGLWLMLCVFCSKHQQWDHTGARLTSNVYTSTSGRFS